MMGSDRDRRLFAVSLVAATALVFMTGARAHADTPAPIARITNATVSGSQLTAVLSLSKLQSAATVDLSSLQLTAGGKLLAVHAQSGAATPGGAPVTREAMLVLDTSGSMAGSRITAATAAAAAYVRQLPQDVQVGLVTFSDKPVEVVAPTANRSAVTAALSRVKAGGNTALYDAITTATRALSGATGARRLIVLSDGEDTSSVSSLTSTIAAVTQSHVGADAIGIGVDQGQLSVLSQIAHAGGGQVTSTSTLSQLATAFSSAAQTFDEQITVTGQVPADLGDKHVPLVVTIKASGQTLTATTTLAVPAQHVRSEPQTSNAPVRPEAAPHSALSTRVPLPLLGITFVVVLAIVGLAFAKPGTKRRERADRLDQLAAYQVASEPLSSAASPAQEGAVAAAALHLVEKAIESSGKRSKIAADLERAGWRIRPQEWILLRIVAGIALIAVLTLLTSSLPLGILVGALVAWIGTRFVLSFKARKRCEAFADQLPDVLQLVASSLRSGFSLSQAVDAIVRDRTEPASSEFARGLAESRLGVPLEDALDGVAERMRCQDLAWVVMAIRISRDVGGNLAEVLLTTVRTMRERAQLKRQVRALSAEGRLSAYILIGLPIVVAAWFALIRPEYLRLLYTTPLGITMIIIGVIGLLVGSWWMSRVIKVEV
jgi:tight adherence protein B